MHAGKQSNQSDSVAGAVHERILAAREDGERRHGVQYTSNIFDLVRNFVFGDIEHNKFVEELEAHVVQRLYLVAFHVQLQQIHKQAEVVK